MTVASCWVGGPSPTGAQVVYSGSSAAAATSCRLVVDTSADLLEPIYSPAGPVSAQGDIRLTVSGLNPATEYFCGLEVDGVLQVDAASRGRFRTLPAEGQPADFDWAAGSCMSAVNPVSMSSVNSRDPLLMLLMGNLHYGNYTTEDPTLWRGAYTAVFGRSYNAAVASRRYLPYVYDDHDFCGEGSYATSTGKLAAAQVYRERVPVLSPLPDSVGCYTRFTVGRVQFILLDTRSYRTVHTAEDDAAKTMLGTTQKAWLKATLLASTAKVKVIMSPVPWHDETGVTEDGWGAYRTEQQELITYFTGHGIENLYFVCGDVQVAADDGTNAPGGYPVVVGGPLHMNSAGVTGEAWSHGVFNHTMVEGSGTYSDLYAWVEVRDSGAGTITLKYSGHDAVTGTRRVEMDTTFVVESYAAVQAPGGTAATLSSVEVGSADHEAEVDVKSRVQNGTGRLWCRASTGHAGGNAGYYADLRLSSAGREVRVVRRGYDGALTVLATATSGHGLSGRLRMRWVGPAFTVWLDEVAVLSGTDTAVSGTRVGLGGGPDGVEYADFGAAPQSLLLLPATPTGLVVSPVSTYRLDLVWAEAARAEGYRIERSSAAVGWATVGRTAVHGVAFTDGDLVPGTAYSYRVFATNDSGESAAATAGGVTLSVGLPAAPRGLTLVGSSGAINATWLAAADGGSSVLDHTRRHRLLPDGAWVVVSGVTGLTASITGLTNSTDYAVEVAARTSAGLGPYSRTETVTVGVSGYPSGWPPAARTSWPKPYPQGLLEGDPAAARLSVSQIDGYVYGLRWDTSFASDGLTVLNATTQAALDAERTFCIANGLFFVLRLRAGVYAPSWVKTRSGGALAWPTSGATVGRWWTKAYLADYYIWVKAISDYCDAWPELRAVTVAMTTTSTADEPLNRQFTGTANGATVLTAFPHAELSTSVEDYQSADYTAHVNALRVHALPAVFPTTASIFVYSPGERLNAVGPATTDLNGITAPLTDVQVALAGKHGVLSGNGVTVLRSGGGRGGSPDLLLARLAALHDGSARSQVQVATGPLVGSDQDLAATVRFAAEVANAGAVELPAGWRVVTTTPPGLTPAEIPLVQRQVTTQAQRRIVLGIGISETGSQLTLAESAPGLNRAVDLVRNKRSWSAMSVETWSLDLAHAAAGREIVVSYDMDGTEYGGSWQYGDQGSGTTTLPLGEGPYDVKVAGNLRSLEAIGVPVWWCAGLDVNGAGNTGEGAAASARWQSRVARLAALQTLSWVRVCGSLNLSGFAAGVASYFPKPFPFSWLNLTVADPDQDLTALKNWVDSEPGVGGLRIRTVIGSWRSSAATYSGTISALANLPLWVNAHPGYVEGACYAAEDYALSNADGSPTTLAAFAAAANAAPFV